MGRRIFGVQGLSVQKSGPRLPTERNQVGCFQETKQVDPQLRPQPVAGPRVVCASEYVSVCVSVHGMTWVQVGTKGVEITGKSGREVSRTPSWASSWLFDVVKEIARDAEVKVLPHPALCNGQLYLIDWGLGAPH